MYTESICKSALETEAQGTVESTLVLHQGEERGSSFPTGSMLLGFHEGVLTEILWPNGVKLSDHEERRHVKMCPLDFLI